MARLRPDASARSSMDGGSSEPSASDFHHVDSAQATARVAVGNPE
ncbi:MAG: hypothetical protein ACRDH8_15440 [Actinomycetota bacterium]